MNSIPQRIAVGALLALVLLPALSCRTAPPLPPADLSASGWHVHQGQAVWKPTRHRTEIAGDFLLATNDNGNYLVQFSKTPFTIATARMDNGDWQIQFGDGHHAWSGRGSPPKRFGWFQLPPALNDSKPQSPWTFTRHPDDSWLLANPRTGETLEGMVFP